MKLWQTFALTITLTGLVHAGAPAPVVNDSHLTVTPVVTGLNVPIALAFIGTNDFLFLEKNSGRVRRVLDGSLQPTAVLDLAVEACGERGLLGIAVHPQFPTMPYVYLFHTLPVSGGDTACGGNPAANRVSRFEWISNTLSNPTTIFEFPVYPNISNHNGGPLAFGPDGKLYAVTGDQGQFCELQNLTCTNFYDDTSVIVRLNDDGTVPTDNPFFAAGGQLARYFAYGVRNSFGLAFDPVSGDLWDTENGASNYDEINLVRPGFNSGWRRLMGPDSRHAGSSNDLVIISGSHYADPKFSWSNVVAPTGIAFLNSTALGDGYENDLFVGDFNEGNLYHFKLNAQRDGLTLTGNLADMVADSNGELNPVIFGTGFAGISDVKTGPDGNLYVVDIGAGAIYVIASRNGGAAHDLAVISLKAPRKITLSEKKPSQTKPVRIVIQNLGSHTETITNETALLNVVNFTIESLGICPMPATALVPPKKGFPLILAPKKKITIKINLTFDCANDNLAGTDHADFRYTVSIDHSALGTGADDIPVNDNCPRAPSGTDKKGCGGKGGTAVLTDVIVKP